MLEILFFPFTLVWMLLGFILNLTGRLITLILAFSFMIIGVILTFTLVAAFIGIPLVLFGFGLLIRALF